MLTVREEFEVTKALHDAEMRWSRTWDAWEAITWAVAHDPNAGIPVTESGFVRVITLQGAKSIELPTITMLYEIDCNEINVYGINICEAVNERANA